MSGLECPIRRCPKVCRTVVIVNDLALMDERGGSDTSVNQAISLFQSPNQTLSSNAGSELGKKTGERKK